MPAAPFVKWAGGKNQLLSSYLSFLPKAFNNYFEPFVGGGAFFFFLFNESKISSAYLNDSNSELVNLYLSIRDDCEQLIEALRNHENNKLSRDYYDHIRNWDRDAAFFLNLHPLERAARTLFLNKTCFNGLYRVNKKGQFNVPFGKYKSPRILDEANLRAASGALSGVKLSCQDFRLAVATAREGDFIYFDPPYHPVSSSAFFTSYTEDNFSYADQVRLAQTFRDLDKRGCKVMLSNSYLQPVLDLYKGYRLEKIMAKRTINCKAGGRGPVPEVLVLNY
ncbi:MAG: DNA adenine methylase [Dethiobacter sp.]|nr:MAG: DNA adenine methylase [Dethiobacter sp.]